MNKIDILKRRDPEYFSVGGKSIVVIACDSCGGIGLKESDVIVSSNEFVGALTARVALMELLSLGVVIKTVSLTVVNESSPTADEIIRGVKSELYGHGVSYVISTEKNMKTSMTGLGVSLVGLVEVDKLRLCQEDKYMVFIAGLPSVGQEVIINQDKILNQDMIKKLLDDDDVLEIIPCGSSGIIGELLKLKNFDVSAYDKGIFKKSCGPATAAIVLGRSNLATKYDFLTCLDKLENI